MRFLIIASYLPSVLNFRGKLLEAIAQRNIEIHILTPDLDIFPDEVKQLRQLGYILHEIPMQRTGTNPIADLKTLLAIYRISKKIKPEYMLAYTIKPVIYGGLATWLASVPHRYSLITGLGYAFQNVEENGGQRSFFQKIVHALYEQSLKHSHKVFFQNPDDLKLFQDLKLIHDKVPTIVVNGSGVNISEFDVVPLPYDDLQQFKVSFLLIARLLIDKGIREYAEAAKQLKQKYPYVEFHLVGWIDENPTAIRKAELDQWVADGRLKFWGKLADVRPAISACSVYVLPSYREGMPRTVLEAMAMGRAIITTDAPGCRETVVDGENGFLIEVKSVDSLVQAMEKMIIQPRLVSIMGQQSREIALNKYDVHQVNQHMMREMGLI